MTPTHFADPPASSSLPTTSLPAPPSSLSPSSPPSPSAELILSELGHAVVVVDPDGIICYWNRAAQEILGWSAEQATGQAVVPLLDVEFEPPHTGRIIDLTGGTTKVSRDCLVSTRDGRRCAMLAAITPIAEGAGLVAIAIVAADTTERQNAEQQRWLGYEHGAVATAIVDSDGRVTRVNPACVQFLERPEHEIVGKRASDFIHPEDPVRIVPERLRSGEIDSVAVERRFLRADGTVVWGLVNLAAVRDNDGEFSHMFVQAQDITDRKRAEDALAHQALHDQVTGLPNRALIQDRLQGALARARRYNRTVAVVFGDIDRFGLVNETLGHRAGDELLVEVAHRLKGATRAGDTVGRFGGDEFVVICEDVEGTVGPEQLGGRVTALFEQPFSIDGQHLFVTISCGVVIAGADDTPESCLRDADNAVMSAKQRGRNRTETFHLKLRHQAKRMLDLEIALRRALDEGRLHMAYQPVMDLATGRPVAAEALIRWRQPSGDIVSPKEFIPLAEQSDLILLVGEFALATAVADISRWRERIPNASELSIAVNLSPRQLRDELVPLCEDILNRSSADPSWLNLEVTERGVMSDVAESIRVLEHLVAIGIAISIDDFGTGYSSLEYLKRLPASMIKIDASFIAELGPESQDSAIVKAVVDLASAIGMQSCAEGVENGDQLAELVALGCRYGQGYYWRRPMQAPAFERWLKALPPAGLSPA